MKAQTNLTQNEIIFFEEASFLFNKQKHIHLESLFGGEIFVPINQLVDALSWPRT
jgi:hypothetical protein